MSWPVTPRSTPAPAQSAGTPAPSRCCVPTGAAWPSSGCCWGPRASTPAWCSRKLTGPRWCPDSVSQRFDRLVVRAGLPPVRLHDLRHLAASLAYRATKDLKLTRQMLGHSSTAITEQVYTSVFEDVEREAAESAAALSRVPTGRTPTPMCPPRAHPRAVWAPVVRP
nr:tyrosine-type recombinase/integrase [Modestobacter versicolor]